MKKKNGFSLIEVLVSICVLSIGVLGAAGMQLAALRTTQQSGTYTVAMQLAVEIADQIRASNSRTQSGESENPYLLSGAGPEKVSVPANASCYQAFANCQAHELAKFNRDDWERRVKTTLPKGRLVICDDAAPWDSGARAYKWECSGSQSSNGQVVIKLGWSGKEFSADSTNEEVRNAPPLITLIVGA